jgi:hypothetical protein
MQGDVAMLTSLAGGTCRVRILSGLHHRHPVKFYCGEGHMKFELSYTASLFSLCLLAGAVSAEDASYKCGQVYSSRPCRNGEQLQTRKINRYAEPAFRVDTPKSITNAVDPARARGTQSGQPLEATRSQHAAVALSGNDAEQTLVQLGIKLCDDDLKQRRRDLCRDKAD